MDTPWGQLKDLDLADRDLCAEILAQDKHQLAEGLVVENLFDQIIDVVPETLPGAIALDLETAIVDTGRQPDRWHAFVWVRQKQDGLGRYLTALERRFRTWLVQLDPVAGTFTASEWKDGGLCGSRRPLAVIMGELSQRYPRSVQVAASVRDRDRQKVSFWGFLSDAYGDQLGPRVILPRLFLNHGIQPWFRAVWNLDRVLVHDQDVWLLEIKHKFPFGRNSLRFGINDGELGVIRLLGEAGIRCFHAILAKPSWTKDSGSGYLLNRMQLKERAALISTVLDRDRVKAMFDGQQGTSPGHTTFSGSGELGYRSLPATAFSQIGMMSELRGQLAARLGQALVGEPLPAVTDRWLRDLRAE
jgi:hypothetical protein